MPPLRTFVLALLLLLQKSSYAQEEFITPSRFITRFPFTQLTGGVILLRASLGTYRDSLNFILDTGSGGISLDSTIVAYFGIKTTPSDKTIRGIGGITNVSFVNGQQLHLPNLTIPDLNFHVNNYALLTAVYGERIDGIIGYSVLSRYIIKVNYDSSHLEFWTKGTMKYPRGGYLLKPLISTLPVNSLKVRDAKTIYARFLYDMGAGLNMMLSSDFVKDSALLNKSRKLYTKQAEGLGGKIDIFTTVIKEVKLGPYRFRNVPVYIFDDTYNVTSYPYLGGLVGNDLLRRFNTILNYDRRDIYLVPNSHFSEQFDYSYTGLELYLVGGKVRISDVAKGSPAEKAGIKEDDVVIGIGKNINGTLQQYKLAMQNAGDRLKIIVEREGELKLFEIKVRNIMK